LNQTAEGFSKKYLHLMRMGPYFLKYLFAE